MTLILTIENTERLSGEMQKTYRLPKQARLDIGRGTGADWILPDPARFVSAKHCEIRWRDGKFWLYDVSTNGTFLNRDRRPLKAPHLLAAGDRIAIGVYIVRVAIEPDTVTMPRPAAVPATAETMCPLRPVAVVA